MLLFQRHLIIYDEFEFQSWNRLEPAILNICTNHKGICEDILLKKKAAAS